MHEQHGRISSRAGGLWSGNGYLKKRFTDIEKFVSHLYRMILGENIHKYIWGRIVLSNLLLQNQGPLEVKDYRTWHNFHEKCRESKPFRCTNWQSGSVQHDVPVSESQLNPRAEEEDCLRLPIIQHFVPGKIDIHPPLNFDSCRGHSAAIIA